MKAGDLRQRATEVAGGIRDLGKRAVENPVAAVFTALAAGFALGLLMRLFDRPRREEPREEES